jgi:hypothetical protein
MNSLLDITSWLLKSRWAQGHRRQIGAALAVATAVVTIGAGPVGALVPALATPVAQGILAVGAAYFGGVGTIFANDPVPAPPSPPSPVPPTP